MRWRRMEKEFYVHTFHLPLSFSKKEKFPSAFFIFPSFFDKWLKFPYFADENEVL